MQKEHGSLSGIEGQEVEASAPRQVAEVSSSGRSNISVSALSSDGKYLVLGNAKQLQILRLEPSGEWVSYFFNVEVQVESCCQSNAVPLALLAHGIISLSSSILKSHGMALLSRRGVKCESVCQNKELMPAA